MRENESIRFITDIFSSAKQSRSESRILVSRGDLLRASHKVDALELRGLDATGHCGWGIAVGFNWRWR